MFNKLLALGIITATVVVPAGMAMSQDNPLCYMENAQQSTLDLSKICGKTPIPMQHTHPQPPQSDAHGGSDGKPPEPAAPLDPTVELVPGQKLEPPVVITNKPSPLWNLIPDLPQSPQEKPAK